ncbi:MAG: FtsW/RodA/SpoVE family cell cycle protein, partial [Candidatus Eremiobacteraeota bacterium]|nr:FtsW/RodA/SpoVE family cell cycle protein [Candidatus Eremiobacteraeota bacterium]
MAAIALGSTKRYLRSVNWPLAVAAVLIGLVGVVCIRSAGIHTPDAGGEFQKQILYLLIGIAAMLCVSLIDYRTWQRWAPGLYVVNFLLLLFILRGGHSAMGAQRWISLGPLGTFQPSEPAKLVVAIALAAVLCRGTYQNLQELWKPLLVVAVPALLILKQPDLGTSLVLMAILTVALFFALPKLGDFGIY